MADVFISYTASDRSRVAPLVRAFEAHGWSVWWDRDIPLGPSFDREIEKAIEAARCVLVCWSTDSVASEWVRTEASEGLARGVLIPVLLDAVQPPLAFRYRQAADLSDWNGTADSRALKPVLSAVQELLQAPSTTSAAALDARRHALREEQTIPTSRRWPRVLIALIALLVVGVGVWQNRALLSPAADASVAVMAFAAGDAAGASEVFGKGLAAEVISYLSTIPGLEVASRTSSFYFQDRPSALADIAQVLQVRYLLEGEVRQGESRTEASVRLVDTRTGRVRTAAKFSESGDQVSLLRIRVADLVTQALFSKTAMQLSGAGEQQPVSATAYEAYLNGLAWLRRPQTTDAFESAISAFDQALQEEPQFAAAYAGRCETYLGQYRKYSSPAFFNAAKRDCDQALELAEGAHDARVHRALASLYREAGDVEASLKELKQGELERAGSAEIQRQYGLTLAAAGEIDRAEERFRRSIALEPSYWDSYVSLADFYYQNGRYDESLHVYEQVLALVPDFPSALIGRGSSYFMRNGDGDEQRAVDDWERAESLGDAVPAGSLAIAFSNLGLRHYYEQQFREAVAMQRKALALAPDDHRFWGRLAESQRGLNNPAAAEDAYRQALRLARKTLEFQPRDWQTLGLAALYAGFLDDATAMTEFLDRAFAVGADKATLHYFSALAQQAIGNSEAAFASLKTAHELGFAKQLIVSDFDLQRLRQQDPERFDAIVDPG